MARVDVRPPDYRFESLIAVARLGTMTLGSAVLLTESDPGEDYFRNRFGRQLSPQYLRHDSQHGIKGPTRWEA